MKKVLLKIVILLLLLILLASTTIYALSTSGERACALLNPNSGGWDKENMDAMENAKKTYDSFGYSTTIIKDPSALTVLSNAISSKVQLYNCHGEVNYLEFKDGGITILDTFTGSNGKTYYNVDGVDWSTKKLLILGACYSAGHQESDSTAIAPVLVRKGAQMSIGWHSELNGFSFPDWLNNFHKEMDNGYNPLVAVNRANNEYWYFNDNVKNTLVSYRQLSTLSDGSKYQIEKSSNNILNNTSKVSNITENQVEDIIKENNPSFDITQYEKTYSDGLYTFNAETDKIEHINSYIDYKLKIGDYLANSGYTVVLDSNGTVEQIIDKTLKKQDIDVQKKQINGSYKVSEQSRQHYLNKAKENINNINDIIEENIDFYYDLNKNVKYANVTLKIADPVLESKLETYTYEIND